jgi:hypothetical protein
MFEPASLHGYGGSFRPIYVDADVKSSFFRATSQLEDIVEVRNIFISLFRDTEYIIIEYTTSKYIITGRKITIRWALFRKSVQFLSSCAFLQGLNVVSLSKGTDT